MMARKPAPSKAKRQARQTAKKARKKPAREQSAGLSHVPRSRKPSAKKGAAGKPDASKFPQAKPWSAAEVEEAFSRFQRAHPAPRGELIHVNAFTLLVAVVLSAQATDAGVNKATPALFAAADTPEKMAALGEDKIRDYIKTIGLYRGKAKNVATLSKILVEQHGGEVPREREALEALPGVGRKTANVVLNIAFGEPTMAVDTHIFRIGNRTGLAPGRNPLEVEMNLVEVIPQKFMLHAHHWLILHGRYICVARSPKCGRCLINEQCHWPDKTKPEFPLAERIATSASVMRKQGDFTAIA
jgi:endonuclease-3